MGKSRDQLPNAPSAYEEFQHLNKHLTDEFIRYGDTPITLVVPERHRSVTLKKEIENLAAPAKASTIELSKIYIPLTNAADSSSLAIVNQDGQYKTLAWTTKPETIRQALRCGVIPPGNIEDKLAKMIAQLGEFNRAVFDRSVEEKRKVVYCDEKLLLVNVAQSCLEACQELNRNLKNYDESKDPQENLQAILVELGTLKNHLMNILTLVTPAADEVPGYKSVMSEGIKKLNDNLDLYQAALKSRDIPELTAAEVQTILQPYSAPVLTPGAPDYSLQHFLQSQVNDIIDNAIVANYTVSGLFVDVSGLNRILTETQFTAEKFSSEDVDYNNPLTAQHAFDFFDTANPGGVVTIDLSSYGFNPSTATDLAKQVALIDRVEQMAKDDKIKLYNNDDKELGIFGTDWLNSPGRKTVETAVAAGTLGLNALRDVGGLVADIIYLPFGAGYKALTGDKTPLVLPSAGEGTLTRIFKKGDTATHAYAQLDVTDPILKTPQTNIRYQSLLQRGASALGNILYSFVAEPLIGIRDFLVDEVVGVKTLELMRLDGAVGATRVDETTVDRIIEECLSQMAANEESHQYMQETFLKTYILPDGTEISYKAYETEFGENKENNRPAIIPYRMSPDRPNDLLSWAANDFMLSLTEVFSHEVYRGRPIAGLAFTMAAATAAPMIAPALAHNAVLGFINQHVTVPIAKAMAGETTGMMPTLTVSLLQGKMAFLATDAFSGSKSLLKQGLQAAFNNPVIAAVVGTAAVGFGYAIAHDMNIPILSQEILESTSQASFPYFELGLAGAKVAAILVEGSFDLHGHKHVPENLGEMAVAKMQGEIREAITKGYKRIHSISGDLTAEQSNAINTQFNDYCNRLRNYSTQPALANQIATLTDAIADVVNPSSAPKPNQVAEQARLYEHFQQQQRRHNIAKLNPKFLTREQKYILENYASETYKENPKFVAAVANRFKDPVTGGPGVVLVKDTLDYVPATIRAATALVRSLGYNIAALVTTDPHRAARRSEMAVHVRRPVSLLGGKIKNDFGKVAKQIASVSRRSLALVSAIVLMPVIIPTITILSSVGVIAETAGGKNSFSKAVKPVTIFSRLNQFLNAPGKISQGIDAIVGSLRADASAKNLNLAVGDMDSIEAKRKVVNSGTAGSTKQAFLEDNNALDAAACAALRQTVTNKKYTHLQSVLDNNKGAPFKNLIAALQAENINQKAKSTLYSLGLGTTSFKSELDKTLKRVHAEINTWNNNSRTQRQPYQDQIMQALNFSDNHPVQQFVATYLKFSQLVLPADAPQNVSADLQNIYSQLKKAQADVTRFNQASLDPNNPLYKDPFAAITKILEDNPCLTMQAMRTKLQLKSIVTSAGLRASPDAQHTEKMLQAVELARAAARSGSYQFATYPSIRHLLTRLHISSESPALSLNSSLASTPTSAHSPHSTTRRNSVVSAAGSLENDDVTVNPRSTVPAGSLDLDDDDDEEKVHVDEEKLDSNVVTPPPRAIRVARTASTTPPITFATSGLLSDVSVKDQIAEVLWNYVSNAWKYSLVDKSAQQILTNLGAATFQRGATPTVALTPHWETYLNTAATPFPAPVMTPKPLLNVVSHINTATNTTQYTMTAITAGPINDTEHHFESTVNTRGQSRILTNKLPTGMDQNPQATGIPSNDYLMLADRQIQVFLEKNGLNAKIKIGGSDPKLVEAYILICEAKGLAYRSNTSAYVPTAAHIEAVKNLPRDVITKVYEPNITVSDALLTELKTKSTAADPVFKILENINQGKVVEAQTLITMRPQIDLSKRTPIMSTAVTSTAVPDATTTTRRRSPT